MKLNTNNNHPHQQLPEEENRNKSMASRAADRIHNLRRKLSRGAANIFRMIKTRGSWGHKQTKNHHESGKPRKP